MKKILNLISLAFLFTVPIFYSALQIGSPALRDQQWACYIVFCILMMAYLIENIWVSGFLLLSLAHMLFFNNPFSEGQLFMTAAASLIFYVFSTRWVQHYQKVLAGLLIINFLMACVQFLGKDVYTWMTWSPNGMLALPAYLGITACLITPLIVNLSPVFLIIGVICVFWSKSLICAIAFVVAMSFYYWYSSRKISILIIALAIGGVLTVAIRVPIGTHAFTLDHLSQSMRRSHVWKMVASKAFRNPFFGYGMGSYKQQIIMELNKGNDRVYFQAKDDIENYPAILNSYENAAKHFGLNPFSSILPVKDPNVLRAIANEIQSLRNNGVSKERWDNPHSEYLYTFFEYGFLGLLFLFGFICSVFGKFFEFIRSKETIALMASFIALLIVSAAHFPFYVARINCLVIAICGMLVFKLAGGYSKRD